MITSAVFKGGGVRVAGEFGAYKRAVEYGLMNDLQRTAGTSAGSMLAAMVALRYSVQEIGQVLATIDYPSFKDGWDPFEEFTKLGLYSGRHLQKFVESLIAAKAGKPFATFADLRKAGFLDLHVVATALNLQTYIVFCADTTPTVIVSEAIRASMSIPLFYGGYRLSQGSNYIYVDGGVVNNYPIRLFDLEQTLGFFVYNPDKGPVDCDMNAEDIALNIFESMLDAGDEEVLRSPELLARTIVINTPYKSTAFNIAPADTDAMIASGDAAMKTYYKAHFS